MATWWDYFGMYAVLLTRDRWYDSAHHSEPLSAFSLPSFPPYAPLTQFLQIPLKSLRDRLVLWSLALPLPEALLPVQYDFVVSAIWHIFYLAMGHKYRLQAGGQASLTPCFTLSIYLASQFCTHYNALGYQRADLAKLVGSGWSKGDSVAASAPLHCARVAHTHYSML